MQICIYGIYKMFLCSNFGLVTMVKSIPKTLNKFKTLNKIVQKNHCKQYRRSSVKKYIFIWESI